MAQRLLKTLVIATVPLGLQRVYPGVRHENVYALLEQDHKGVADICEQLTATDNDAADVREALFTELKNAPEAHTEAEEKVFYPALKESHKTHDLTVEAIEEYHAVDRF